jgi:hypothetical protein
MGAFEFSFEGVETSFGIVLFLMVHFGIAECFYHCTIGLYFRALVCHVRV